MISPAAPKPIIPQSPWRTHNWFKWLSRAEVGHGNSVDFNQCLPALMYGVFNTPGATLFEAADEGACELKPAEVYSFMSEELGARLVWSDIVPAYRSLWIWNDGAGYVTVGVEKDGSCNVTMRVANLRKEIAEVAKAWMRKHFKPRVSNGKVHVMIATSSGLALKSMGVAAEEFVRENYNPDVVESVEHVLEDLRRPDPCGRISIIDGPPGTGKTFLIRAMVNEVRNALFVMVPSNSVSALGDPGVIKLLIDLKEEEKDEGRPIILILEDADSALGARGADNMPLVSTLLNFGDGLFGKLMDTRILATTNAKIGELDEAITRPGRLCKHVHVGALDVPRAQRVYDRITEGKGARKFNKATKLADIYREARGDGWEPGKAKTGMGFRAVELPTSESSPEVKEDIQSSVAYMKDTIVEDATMIQGVTEDGEIVEISPDEMMPEPRK